MFYFILYYLILYYFILVTGTLHKAVIVIYTILWRHSQGVLYFQPKGDLI